MDFHRLVLVPLSDSSNHDSDEARVIMNLEDRRVMSHPSPFRSTQRMTPSFFPTAALVRDLITFARVKLTPSPGPCCRRTRRRSRFCSLHAAT